ncbi:rod-binding protein [Salipiger abyssi]|nr:rod-binding protein [Salipiger abyssi]
MEINGPPPPTRPDPLRSAAVALEASFLTEMLKAAGFGESRDAFGGGAGEEQFASFLRREHAQTLAETGGIGLAESLYHALKDRMDD